MRVNYLASRKNNLIFWISSWNNLPYC